MGCTTLTKVLSLQDFHPSRVELYLAASHLLTLRSALLELFPACTGVLRPNVRTFPFETPAQSLAQCSATTQPLTYFRTKTLSKPPPHKGMFISCTTPFLTHLDQLRSVEGWPAPTYPQAFPTSSYANESSAGLEILCFALSTFLSVTPPHSVMDTVLSGAESAL